MISRASVPAPEQRTPNANPAEASVEQSPVGELVSAVLSLGKRAMLAYPGCAQLEIYDSPAGSPAPENQPTIVWITEMGQALHGAANAANLFRLAALRQKFPNHRFVILGMPDGTETATHFTTNEQRAQAAQADFQALHDPLCRYLAATGAGELYVGGCSGGAEIGADLLVFLARLVKQDPDVGLHPTRFAYVEAPGIRARTVLELGVRFLLTATGVRPYVQGADSTYRLALHLQTLLLPYIATMFTPDNRAIAQGFSRAQFVARVDQAMKELDALRGTVVWGLSTEFGPSRYVLEAIQRLRAEHSGRLEAFHLGKHRHALCRDPQRIAAVALRAFSEDKAA